MATARLFFPSPIIPLENSGATNGAVATATRVVGLPALQAIPVVIRQQPFETIFELGSDDSCQFVEALLRPPRVIPGLRDVPE